MKRTVTVKVPTPLLIPFAMSHFKDEHGTFLQSIEIHNEKISGFTVEAKVDYFRQFIDSFTVQDLYHDGNNIAIFTDDNFMSGEKWIEQVISIPENKLAIKRSLEKEQEEFFRAN